MKKTDSTTPPQTQYATPDSPSSGTATATASATAGYDYPPYEVHFSGVSMKPIKVTGPHTFALLQPGGGKITVSLSRNPATAGKPNLSIKFT